MSKPNLVLWHIGLGDALICNGLVRELHAQLSQLTLPVLPKYQPSIEWMFGDLSGITVLPLHGFAEDIDDLGMRRRHLRAVINLEDFRELPIGMLNRTNSIWQGERPIDMGFYDHAGVPFSCKWSKFFHRTHPQQIVPPAEPYVFVHMDVTRRLTFEPQIIRKDCRIVTNLDWKTDNLFVWQHVLEQAQEIHVMDSAFANWVELMPTFAEKPMFLYDAKHFFGGPGFPTYSRRPWQVVTQRAGEWILHTR